MRYLALIAMTFVSYSALAEQIQPTLNPQATLPLTGGQSGHGIEAKSNDEITDEIVSDVAEKNGYCDKKPQSKKGDVVIYWTRDSSGRCIVQNMEVSP